MQYSETEAHILSLLGTAEPTNIDLAVLLCESQLGITFDDFLQKMGFWDFDLFSKQCFINLEEIDISINDEQIDAIMDAYDLQEPHEALEYMDLVENISSLGYLKNLQFLHISGHKIVNISPLAHLNKLTDLNLASNRIEDISPLFGLKDLEYVCLSDNPFPKEQAQTLQKYLPNCFVEY